MIALSSKLYTSSKHVYFFQFFVHIESVTNFNRLKKFERPDWLPAPAFFPVLVVAKSKSLECSR
jgi:hypothetical protein